LGREGKRVFSGTRRKRRGRPGVKKLRKLDTAYGGQKYLRLPEVGGICFLGGGPELRDLRKSRKTA